VSAEPDRPQPGPKPSRRSEPIPLEILEVLHDPQPDEELIMHLERDQLVSETFRPVPRARLGARAELGLWALRVFVVIVSLMVIYTFIADLH
jgi:hypothetical protein